MNQSERLNRQDELGSHQRELLNRQDELGSRQSELLNRNDESLNHFCESLSPLDRIILNGTWRFAVDADNSGVEIGRASCWERV